jgi:hypothetical protein
MTKPIADDWENSCAAYRRLITIASFRVRIKERFMESNRSNAEIIAEFKKKRTRQIMAVGPIILAFIGILSVSVLVFSFLNWRCPSCNKYLGKAINPKFCSKCGTQLG